MKEIKNVQETMEQEVVVEETGVAAVEEKEPGKLAKAGKFIKKHGKKIAIGAGVALAGAAVFLVKAAMKAKAGDDADLDFIDDIEGVEDENEIIDIPADDVEISE